MRISLTPAGWEDYLHWQKADPAILARINDLVRDCRRSPFKGIGKPEPLRGELQGWWSRRITGEHRLVYRVEGQGSDQHLQVLTCRFHDGRR